ncbi:MAG: sterol desaturase family protein [Desulfarculus sp.]|nr:sterol desaturase family protein [Desulfarculus sp.]
MLDANAALIRLLTFGGGLVFFLVMEISAPYRLATVSKLRRWAVNLGLTALNTLLLAALFGTAKLALAQHVTQNKLGLLNVHPLPYGLKLLIAVAFLDFMLYVWHLLNHEVPLLWRFHRVHHSDLNMDVSTATRFHIGELFISALITLGLIYLIGADPLSVIVFEASLGLCAQFQHSSLKAPAWLEGLWWILFVPPSMHRIHHSVKIKERNSNYGTIFSLWDRALGTLLTQVDQAGIRIGVGGHFDAGKLGLGRLLVMPFTRYVR